MRHRFLIPAVAIPALVCAARLGPALASEIHDAVRAGDIETIRNLVAQDPRLLEARDTSRRTPLHRAARRGDTKVVRLLIDMGAEVDAKDGTGKTALHRAADIPSPETCRILVSAGAGVEVRDEFGLTPLHLAAIAPSADACRVLVEAGADLNAPTEAGLTPLHAALGLQGQTHSRRTRRPGESLYQRQQSCEVLEFLARTGADLNARTIGGSTPLHDAVRAHRRDAVELLVAAGADPRIPDGTGTTPLDLAREERIVMTDGVVIRDADRELIVPILERAVARQKLANAESQFRAAATCALTCAGLLGLGFAVIVVKMIRQNPNRRAAA
jgi:ankyrin repeat protein